MPEGTGLLAATLFDGLTAVSGTVAFSFIVALALGLAAMVVLFLTSAVVVLDRFARTARSPLWIGGAALVWAALAGIVAARTISPDAIDPSIDPDSLRRSAFAVGAIATAVAMALVALALRRLDPGRLAGLTCALLASGYALVMGAAGNRAACGVALVLSASAALILRQLGRRRGERLPAAGWAALLTGILALGTGLAFALPAPHFELAGAGVALGGSVVALILLGLLPLAFAGLAGLRLHHVGTCTRERARRRAPKTHTFSVPV